MLAALEARTNWDESKSNGAKFFTYLTKYVTGRLKRFKRQNTYDISVSEYKALKDIEKLKSEDNHSAPPSNNPGFAIRLDWSTDDEGAAMADVIPSGAPSPDITLIKKEQIEILMSEVGQLSEKEQFVLNARFVEGRKLDEIASDMDIRRQTVHAIQKKAIEKLRTKLTKRLGDDIII